MIFLRSKFPDIRISPKLHILEDHVVPFIRRYGAGSGFYGEQGGESINKTINAMKNNYSLAAANPNASSKRVLKMKKNLKRPVDTNNLKLVSPHRSREQQTENTIYIYKTYKKGYSGFGLDLFFLAAPYGH